MKRTTISVPDEVLTLLELAARRRSSSVSRVVREAIMTYVGVDGSTHSPPFANLGNSGRGDTAADMEDLMSSEWQV